ncbi:serine/threonine-protein phosphatase 6 regulatory ankyrin repeat subunit C-like isoform X2 [Acropora millepora]|nr:serine/threonine-protein phosphatase 6 regulatory ankyrin repeat subunit C-like isoform X2 [Acropora millepora]XP_029202793.2 serine/threonine-protein phosphatase 6 regulatory ankyrin repeat subunit C-like isoform X2 [Acropora millepora]XP_044184677.1 serine/threonine-protein phosphatase 6 regulatory ankyrin repeat subunit C-like isoform X2 [Acropora millepora]
MVWADELLSAVHFDNHAEAMHLLQQGHPPNSKTNVTTSPLHLAVEHKDIQMCKLLLEYNADVNWCDSDGQSALFTSTESEISYEIFELLLVSGGKVDMFDIFERTPLHYAVNFLEVDKVRRLLQTPGVQVNAVDYQGCSALHHIITMCDIETDFSDLKSIVKLLLDTGADPNQQDSRGLSALHLAIMHDIYFVELTTLLLSSCKSIKFEVKSLSGENFLHLLFKRPLYEENAVQFLEELLWGKFIPESVFPLLLNMQNVNGLTPFCLYMSNPFEEKKIFKQLLALGAEATFADNLGETPLMKACFLNNVNYALALIDHGALINSQDIFGRSTVYRARSAETVSFLLERGVDLQTVDKFGRSVLCQNLLVSDLDCVEFLIHKGGNVNQPDGYGSCPLHYAAYTDNIDLIKLLLEQKADPCLMDQEGHTAQDVATIHKCRNALQIFQGVEIKETSASCMTAHDLLWCDVHELRHPEETCDLSKLKKLKLTGDVVSVCDEVLQEHSILLSVHHRENEKICKSMACLMETIAQRMGEVEELFTTSVLPSGSVAEGTKTGDPDEFDFIFCLTKFADACDVMEEETSKINGLVKGRSKTEPAPKVSSHFFDDAGFIVTQNLRVAFNQVLSRIIQEEMTWRNSSFVLNGFSDGSEEIERPAFSVQLIWISCHHKYLDVSVDIVPAIYPRSWWPQHVNTTALPLMTKPVEAEGCLLLVLSQEERGPEEDSEFNLRISCLPAERHLMTKLPQEVKDAYMLAKVLVRDDICPVISFRGDVTTKDHAVRASSVIKSYMLKNCLLHVLSGELSLISGCQGELLSKRNLMKFTLNLTIKIFEKLKQLGEEEFLPAYFLPSQNILNYEDLMIYNNDAEEIEENTHELAANVGLFCSLNLNRLAATP